MITFLKSHSMRSLRALVIRRRFCITSWKPCVSEFLNINRPDLEVSNMGHMRRIRTGYVMKCSSAGNYQQISLKTDQKMKTWKVHRLVCVIFNGPPSSPEKNFVHHINHEGIDNRAINLMWVSPRENCLFLHGSRSKSIGCIPTIQCTLNGNTVQEFSSVKDAADSVNVYSSAISRAIRTEDPVKGFLWKRKISNLAICLPGEKWETISEFPKYKVSSHGRVKNTRKNSILSTSLVNGYPTITIMKKHKLIHRLVAMVFCEKQDGKDYVDHIDGDRKNNHYTNLRWVTHTENRQNPVTCRKLNISVDQYSACGRFIATFSSMMDAERSTGVRHQSISRCCRGHMRSAGGFIWKFSKNQ